MYSEALFFQRKLSMNIYNIQKVISLFCTIKVNVFLTKSSAGFNQGVSEKAVRVIINREDKPIARRLGYNNCKQVGI